MIGYVWCPLRGRNVLRTTASGFGAWGLGSSLRLQIVVYILRSLLGHPQL